MRAYVRACVRACVRVRACVCVRVSEAGGRGERNYYVEMNKYVTKVFPPRTSLSHNTFDGFLSSY